MGNILQDLLPPKARQWLYVITSLVLLGLTAWQASEGNVAVAITSFLTSLVPVLAAGNVGPKPDPEE